MMKLPDDMVASLEEALQADTRGNLGRDVLRSLASLESHLTAETQKLQRPEDYRMLEAAADAVKAAQQAMALYQSGNP
jgi:hypothetical protein